MRSTSAPGHGSLARPRRRCPAGSAARSPCPGHVGDGRRRSLRGGPRDRRTACAVIRSEGRTHPVTVHHRPQGARDRLDSHVARVVGTAIADHPEGDVLVFLPGAADIRRVGDRLTAPGALPPTVDVRPLFGALSIADQDRALAPSPDGRRRVVRHRHAESSLTGRGAHRSIGTAPLADAASAMTCSRPSLRRSPPPTSAGRRPPRPRCLPFGTPPMGPVTIFPVPEIAVADLATSSRAGGVGCSAVRGPWSSSLSGPHAQADAPAPARRNDVAGRPTARGKR
jgi:ATP-dependent helicase HrpB